MTRIVAGFTWLLAATSLGAQSSAPIWEWDFAQVDGIVNRIRAGKNLTPKEWPNGARVAVALSFDMDAETVSLRTNIFSPQALSRGEYGPRVGVPRILELAEKYDIPLTFFIPAVSGHLHPEAVDAILKSRLQHEIGIHGWIHEDITKLPAGEERKLARQAFDWWTQRLGHKPAGIRTPSWDFTPDTLSIIGELGLYYDSSLMGDDRPYEVTAAGKPTGLVELPVEWILDDHSYYFFDPANYEYHRMGDDEVYEIYKGEFDKAYDEGTLFLLTMHPFVTGHRSRIAALERLVVYMQSKPHVWFATEEQIARVAAAQLRVVR